MHLTLVTLSTMVDYDISPAAAAAAIVDNSFQGELSLSLSLHWMRIIWTSTRPSVINLMGIHSLSWGKNLFALKFCDFQTTKSSSHIEKRQAFKRCFVPLIGKTWDGSIEVSPRRNAINRGGRQGNRRGRALIFLRVARQTKTFRHKQSPPQPGPNLISSASNRILLITTCSQVPR